MSGLALIQKHEALTKIIKATYALIDAMNENNEDTRSMLAYVRAKEKEVQDLLSQSYGVTTK